MALWEFRLTTTHYPDGHLRLFVLADKNEKPERILDNLWYKEVREDYGEVRFFECVVHPDGFVLLEAKEG